MYIDFGKTPVKEGDKPKPIFTCENCIHRIFIPGGIYRCSLTNNYIFGNQIFQEDCLNKDTDKGERKIIVGLFTFNGFGDTTWTGILTYGNVNDCDDQKAFTEIEKNNEKQLTYQIPNYKDMILISCIIAESRNNKPFVIKTKLIPKNVIDEIIADANSRFLNK